MSVYLWVLLGIAVLDIRKGAFWGTASILSDATIQTVN